MKTETLFEEYRGGVLECIHQGMICVVDKDGVVASAGDADWMCFYRSCSKPIQSLPVIMREIDKKYGLTAEETALFSGSHAGDPIHVQAAESIMKKTGLKEEQLIMLPTYPGRQSERERLLREGKPPRKIYHNCSGKHLAMMLLARELGEPVEQYWVRGSRTQSEILKVISEMTDVLAEEIKIGVDGCGVPVYAVPFHAIATSYLRLVRPELIVNPELRKAVERNMEMLHRNPNMIGCEGSICSTLTVNQDLTGKSGAQGVYTFGIKSLGLGVVFKIMDGSQDEFAAGVLEICRQLGYENEALEELKKLYSNVVINDNKEEVGERKPVFKLVRR